LRFTLLNTELNIVDYQDMKICAHNYAQDVTSNLTGQGVRREFFSDPSAMSGCRTWHFSDQA